MLRYIPSPLPSSLQFLLHMAASSGVPDCVSSLDEFCGARHFWFSQVDALLSVGCDVNGEDLEGMRPLDLCPRRGKAYTLIQRAGGIRLSRSSLWTSHQVVTMVYDMQPPITILISLWLPCGGSLELPTAHVAVNSVFSLYPYLHSDRSCAEQRLLDWHLVAASACGSRIAVEALLDWGADPSAMVKSSSPPNRDVCTIEVGCSSS